MKVKKLFAKATSLFMAGILTISLSAASFAKEVFAENSGVSAQEQALIGDILSYYNYHTKGDFNADNGWTVSSMDADIDIQRCLAELTALNPGLGKAFTEIMDCWEYADTTMPINHDVLPDGLPNDNSLCIVTLGFQLDQTTGEMQPELIDRLNVTLASALKYPNAYIAVTGGGTSPADPTKTEGEEMGKWLIAHGVDESRIIVENKAPTTVGNATNTFALLKEKPEVTSIAMISSASHVQRGVAIFNAVFQLEAYKANTSALTILGNAGCPVERKETLAQQVNSVLQGINFCLESDIQLLDSIELSTPASMELANVEKEYIQNADVEPKVTDTFTTADGNTFQTDITNHVNTVIENIDTGKLGMQVLKASFTYNNKTVEVQKEVTVKAAPAVQPDKPEAPAVEPNKPAPKTGDSANIALLFACALLCSIVVGSKRKRA